MGRAMRRRPTRPGHDARFQRRREHGRLRAAMPRGQSGQPVLREAVLPQRDGPRTAAGHGRDRRVAVPVGQQQNHAGPARRVGSPAPRSHAGFELGALVRGQNERRRREWHAPSYDLEVVRYKPLVLVMGLLQIVTPHNLT